MLREAIANGQQYDAVLQQIRKSKEDAIKSTTGFKGALKSLGGVAKTVGVSLLQGIASMAISWAVNAAIDAIDKQVNAVKYAKETLAEYADEWQDLQDKQKSAGNLVQKYGADYERLSKGVNMVTGENLSLSDDEYELFKQINTELADSALSTVEGITVAYDAQGQAIIRLSGQMDSLGDAYKALEAKTRGDIVAGLPDVWNNTYTALTGRESAAQLIRTADALRRYAQGERDLVAQAAAAAAPGYEHTAYRVLDDLGQQTGGYNAF